MTARRRPIAWMVAIFASVAVVVAGVVAFRVWRDPVRRLRQSASRRLATRLSGFPYQPLHVMRSEPDTSVATLSAAADIESEYNRAATPQNTHDYAVALLLIDKRDRGLQLLNQAVASRPNDPAILNDLSAAQFTAGYVADAAENAAKAIDVDPENTSALFNWAIAIEALENRPAAVRAWKNYLAHDSTSGWAAEAKQHLTDLHSARHVWETDKKTLRPGIDKNALAALVSRYPQRVRTLVQDEILPRWIDERRPEDLALLQDIGDARSRNGDPFLRDLATEAMSPTNSFADGIRAFRDARTLSRDRKLAEAQPMFERSEALLRNARSPFAIVAALYLASNENYQGKGDSAYARAAAVEAQCADYPSLGAETWWIRGLIHGTRSEYAESLDAQRKGLDLARRGGETEHVFSLTSLIATTLDELGDTEGADKARLEALREMNEAGAPLQRRYVANAEAGRSALQRHHPHVALAFIDTQDDLAHEAKDPLLLSESATARAVALRDLNHPTPALESLQTAQSIAANVETPALRDRSLAETEYVKASIQRDRAPNDALACLTSATRRWQSSGWPYHAASAHLVLGDIRLSLGDRRAAEEEYRTGIAAMEQERRKVGEPSLRISYFEKAENLFERLIQLLVDQRRFDDAFTVAERRRARALLDASGVVTERRLFDRETIQRSLQDNEVVIEYQLLPTTVVIWCITRAGTTALASPTSIEQLAASITREHMAIVRGDYTAMQRENTWLYDRLIAPVSTYIRGKSSAIIVPDGVLYQLPYASLLDANGHFLAESIAVIISPSASLHASSPPAWAAPTRVLAVAQPAPADFPALGRAAAELREVATLYPSATTFAGATVNPRDFLRRSADADIIIFIGHAAGDALVFESATKDHPSLLSAREIAQSRLPKRPLVVLAGCETGSGRLRALEGVDSLAVSFLTAGARGVVATLADIDDRASSPMFTSFYRALQSGATPQQALRNAQMTFAHAPNTPPRESLSWTHLFLLAP